MGVANVTAPTTLHTGGLITCLAWVLYNEHAAYMCHIVLEAPTTHVQKIDGLAAQVEELHSQFRAAAGAPATGLHLAAALGSAGGHYKTNVLPEWMLALVPHDVPAPSKLILEMGKTPSSTSCCPGDRAATPPSGGEHPSPSSRPRRSRPRNQWSSELSRPGSMAAPAGMTSAHT